MARKKKKRKKRKSQRVSHSKRNLLLDFKAERYRNEIIRANVRKKRQLSKKTEKTQKRRRDDEERRKRIRRSVLLYELQRKAKKPISKIQQTYSPARKLSRLREIRICNDRLTRRMVMFALSRAGKGMGGPKRRKYTIKSSIKC